MPFKDFLEDYSLFRKYYAEIPDTMDKMDKPAINMHCRDCKSVQTFNMTNEYWKPFGYTNVPLEDSKIQMKYLCESCKSFERHFDVFVSPELDYVYKYGQYPKWEIKIDNRLKEILVEHTETYKKGLICESQGYGIGAFAYYRRITEEIIEQLLDSVTDLIEPKHLPQYQEALEKTKRTTVTSDKIELVKDLLPESLRPNGMNPLSILHGELSKGIHNETDEECLEIASNIRKVLTYLVKRITESKKDANEFTEGMKSFLHKKSNNK
jgi:hypothetical protein